MMGLGHMSLMIMGLLKKRANNGSSGSDAIVPNVCVKAGQALGGKVPVHKLCFYLFRQRQLL